MSEPLQDVPDYLISTTQLIGGTEYEVTVCHNGISYWFDPSAKKRALAADPYLVVKAISGDEIARQALANINSEYTIEAPVPPESLVIIRDELSPLYWAEEFSPVFDARLDAILLPIFHKHVNPFTENEEV